MEKGTKETWIRGHARTTCFRHPAGRPAPVTPTRRSALKIQYRQNTGKYLSSRERTQRAQSKKKSLRSVRSLAGQYVPSSACLPHRSDPKMRFFRDQKIPKSAPSRCLESCSTRKRPIRRKWLILATIDAFLSKLGG